MYLYTHTHIYLYTHTHIYLYIHTYTHTHIHTYTQVAVGLETPADRLERIRKQMLSLEEEEREALTAEQRAIAEAQTIGVQMNAELWSMCGQIEEAVQSDMDNMKTCVQGLLKGTRENVISFRSLVAAITASGEAIDVEQDMQDFSQRVSIRYREGGREGGREEVQDSDASSIATYLLMDLPPLEPFQPLYSDVIAQEKQLSLSSTATDMASVVMVAKQGTGDRTQDLVSMSIAMSITDTPSELAIKGDFSEEGSEQSSPASPPGELPLSPTPSYHTLPSHTLIPPLSPTALIVPASREVAIITLPLTLPPTLPTPLNIRPLPSSPISLMTNTSANSTNTDASTSLIETATTGVSMSMSDVDTGVTTATATSVTVSAPASTAETVDNGAAMDLPTTAPSATVATATANPYVSSLLRPVSPPFRSSPLPSSPSSPLPTSPSVVEVGVVSAMDLRVGDSEKSSFSKLRDSATKVRCG